MASFARAVESLSFLLFVLLVLASISVISVDSELYGRHRIWNKKLLDGWEADIAPDAINYWSKRRALLEEPQNGTGAGVNGRPLAVKDGRLDPFNGFRKYRGGYDLESKHYWGSLVFTGIFGYVLAAACLLIGLILRFSHCCMRCFYGKKSRRAFPIDPSRATCCWLAVFSIVLFTIAILGGCVALYIANINFTVQARRVEGSLIKGADSATDIIRNITTAITIVQQLLKPYQSNGSTLEIAETKAGLTRESIQHTIDDNTDIFHKIITSMEAALIVMTTLSIIGVIMGPVCAAWNWRRIFSFIVVASWIMAVFNSFLFGLYFMFNNAVEDTCDAMNEYMDQPYNTTLDALLPCEDLLSARGAVVDIAKEIRSFVTSVNNTLNSLQQLLGNSLTELCEQIGPPPDYLYISSCPNNTVTIGDLPKELEPLRCSRDDTVSCYQQKKFLTESDYQKVMAYASSAQILLITYPTVNRLTDCSIIVNTFSELLEGRCGPANSTLRVIWISFLVVALTMIFVILSWLLLYYPNKTRKLRSVIAPQEMTIWTHFQTK